MKKQQRVPVHHAVRAPAPTTRRQRGRPATTIAAGMTKNTFVKKCKDLNGAISHLKKCMFIIRFLLHAYIQTMTELILILCNRGIFRDLIYAHKRF